MLDVGCLVHEMMLCPPLWILAGMDPIVDLRFSTSESTMHPFLFSTSHKIPSKMSVLQPEYGNPT